MRIVATLTTLPDRYSLLAKTVVSLDNQKRPFDAIYLTMPKVCKRLGTEYPPLPKEISAIVTVVKVKQDYGPITKLLGGLYRETDPNTVIVTVDDDVVYPPDLVEKIEEISTSLPNGAPFAIGAAGYTLSAGLSRAVCYYNRNGFFQTFISPKIPLSGYDVDILYGFSGIAYRRGFFPEKKALYDDLLSYTEDRDVFANDDILISAYLAKRGIRRRVFPQFTRLPSLDESNESGLSYDKAKMIKSVLRTFDKLKDHFPSSTHSFTDSPVGCLIILLIFFLLLFLLWVSSRVRKIRTEEVGW